MTLLVEIFLRIFDMLAEDHDMASLKNCALACSQLAALCQSHRFACVMLPITSYSRRANNLWQVLQANPKLGTHIKELHISFGRAQTEIYANPTIPPILAYCTSVTSFKLEMLSVRLSDYLPVWPTSLPRVTLDALESIIYSPKLTRLEIKGFGLPPLSIFLSPCSSALNELHLLKHSFESDIRPGTDVRGAKGSPISLRKLSVQGAIPLSSILEADLGDGRSLFDLSQLQELDAHFKMVRSGQDYNALLARHGAPLTRFRLTFSGDRLPEIRDIFAHDPKSSLPCFSTLRFIEVTVMRVNLAPNEALFHDMIIALRHFPEENVVESIVFNIEVVARHGEAVISDEWLTLATSFTTGFPCLKGLDVYVGVYDFSGSNGLPAIVEGLKELPFKDLDLPFNFNFTVTANPSA